VDSFRGERGRRGGRKGGQGRSSILAVCVCLVRFTCLSVVFALNIISHHHFSIPVLILPHPLSLLPLPLDGLDDEEVVQRIRGVVKLKKKSLGGHDSPEALSKAMNRPMILIGG
jgi:hypothetical protein